MDRTGKYLKLYPSFAKQFDLLTDKELAKLVRAFLSYLETDEEPTNLSPSAQMAFSFIVNLSAKDKRGAPIGNSNAKKQIKQIKQKKQLETNKTIKNKKNKKNNNDELNLIDFSEENLAKNSEIIEPEDEKITISDEKIDNNEPNSADKSIIIEKSSNDFGYKQNYINNFVSLVCLRKNNINNNMRVRALEEKQKCKDENFAILRKKFETPILSSRGSYWESQLIVVLDSLANILTEPPNNKYSAEQISNWVNILSDDEFCRICESVTANRPIHKPDIYILKALENTINERHQKIEVWVC